MMNVFWQVCSGVFVFILNIIPLYIQTQSISLKWFGKRHRKWDVEWHAARKKVQILWLLWPITVLQGMGIYQGNLLKMSRRPNIKSVSTLMIQSMVSCHDDLSPSVDAGVWTDCRLDDISCSSVSLHTQTILCRGFSSLHAHLCRKKRITETDDEGTCIVVWWTSLSRLTCSRQHQHIYMFPACRDLSPSNPDRWWM